jgi:hypothetical protein
VRNEELLQRIKEERNIVQIITRRKVNWISHILRRNCRPKHVIDEKMGEGYKSRGDEDDVRSY